MSAQKRLKEKLILNRLSRVYCRLGPSPIHGVGIFAIKDIPEGTNPFKESYLGQDAILVNKASIKEEYKKVLNDFHPSEIPDNLVNYTSSKKQETTEQVVPAWPNQLKWTDFINYSDEPNIELMENGEWLTLRDIKKGEEILEDPKRLFNENGQHKVFRVTENQYLKLQ